MAWGAIIGSVAGALLSGGDGGGSSAPGQQWSNAQLAPLAPSTWARTQTPMAMKTPDNPGGVDYKRYGMGPQQSFFKNTTPTPTSPTELDMLRSQIAQDQTATRNAVNWLGQNSVGRGGTRTPGMAVGYGNPARPMPKFYAGGGSVSPLSRLSRPAMPAHHSRARALVMKCGGSVPMYADGGEIPAPADFEQKVMQEVVKRLMQMGVIPGGSGAMSDQDQQMMRGGSGAMSDQDQQMMQGPPQMARGGSPTQARSPLQHVTGHGGGQSDKVDARLSPGEYVMDADVVSALGDGDTTAGSKALDVMRNNIRAHKRGAPANKIPPMAKPAMAYLRK